MLDEGRSKSEDGKGEGRAEAPRRKFRVRLPAFPRLPRLQLPTFARSPRVRLPGLLRDPRSHLPEFLGDLPGVAARRWPAMLLAFAVGLASTFWILAGAQLVYRAQATVLITRPALDDDGAPQAVDEGAIQSIGATLDAVFSDESLSGLIDRFDLYSESGDAQPDALVAHMRGSIDAESMPRLAQSRGGDTAMAYGFSFASGDPITASAVANALAVRFQELSNPEAGDPTATTPQGVDGGAPAAGEGTTPETSDSASPGAVELALLKAQLRSAQAEIARLNDPDAGSSSATQAPAFQVSILDPAMPPTSPQRTRTVVAFTGFLASLLLAAGVACLLELVDPALLSAAQLSRFSDAPILGSLPRIA
jgi:hypothetical protein